jgi:hypothetical protein
MPTDRQEASHRLEALMDGRIDRTVRLLAEQDLIREGLLLDEEPERSRAFSPELSIAPVGQQLLDFVRYMSESDESSA